MRSDGLSAILCFLYSKSFLILRTKFTETFVLSILYKKDNANSPYMIEKIL